MSVVGQIGWYTPVNFYAELLPVQQSKSILLIDLDDSRRQTRVSLLKAAGYEVELRIDSFAAERRAHEGDYDLIVIALKTNSPETTNYTLRLSKRIPDLPILLLVDNDAYVPPGTLAESLDAGNPAELIRKIAQMLVGSTHVREIKAAAAD